MTLAVIAALVSQWRQTVRSEVEAGGGGGGDRAEPSWGWARWRHWSRWCGLSKPCSCVDRRRSGPVPGTGTVLGRYPVPVILGALTLVERDLVVYRD